METPSMSNLDDIEHIFLFFERLAPIIQKLFKLKKMESCLPGANPIKLFTPYDN